MISEKISSVLLFCPGLLLHVSRGVRWDSDHVVILDDELIAIAKEMVRSGKLDRIHLGLDYFDASINRVAAWVIGTRNMLKALLHGTTRAHRHAAPHRGRNGLHAAADAAGGDRSRCRGPRCGITTVPSKACRWAPCWFEAVRQYERDVLSQR